MESQVGSRLGILGLEPGLSIGVTLPAPPSGSRFGSATFDFPVVFETVEGVWADLVMQGDPRLETAFVAASSEARKARRSRKHLGLRLCCPASGGGGCKRLGNNVQSPPSADG